MTHPSYRLLVAAGLIALLPGCDLIMDGGGAGDGTRFLLTIENVSQSDGPVRASGVFNTPVGATDPAPIGPGGAYEVQFQADPGDRLSFATMFIQSNDLFYTFPGQGLALYDGAGQPVTGDVTDQVLLYDAGTEVNEEPGTGPNQAPRQSGPDTGDDENGVLGRIEDGAAGRGGFTYPNVADVIGVSLDYSDADGFTLLIENRSTDSTLTTSTGNVAVPLSPGAWAVHSDAISFFESGQPAPAGIEAIAEDGNAAVYADALAGLMGGMVVPLSPGAWAVHSDAVQLYTAGEAASEGIERIAEDGNPGVLADVLATLDPVSDWGVFDTPIGSSSPSPIGPGGRYIVGFEAMPGDLLSFATMYIQSNDLFYGFQPEGLPLFENGAPISGNLTDQVLLFDAGTEVDEEPGTGPNQAPRQGGPDTGEDENGTVVLIEGENDGYTYPAPSQVIRVTIQPLG